MFKSKPEPRAADEPEQVEAAEKEAA
jgi:hypothetical protein